MDAMRSRSLDLLHLTAKEGESPAEFEAISGEELGVSITSGFPDDISDLFGHEAPVGFDGVLVLDGTGDDTAITTIEEIRDRDSDIPILLLSDFDRGNIVPTAFEAGVTDVLPLSTLEEQPDTVIDRMKTFVNDTTSTRQQEILEEEREKYATLVEQSSDGIVVVQDEAYVFVNERFCDLTGYSREQLLGMPFYEVFTPEYRDVVKERYHERVAGGSPPQRYDVDIETADGDVLTLDLSVSGIQHEGAPATMANFRDVTEERELERTYREVFEGVSDGLVVHEPDTGEMCHVNEQFCELTGYSREELIGETVDLINPPGYSYEDAQERIERAQEEGSLLFEWRDQTKDGDIHPVEVHLRTVQIRGEERVLASVRDITERKRRQREYEHIFNGVNDIVNVYDPRAGDLVAVNDTLCDVTGYDRERILEEGISLISATDAGYTAERAATIIDDVIESGESRNLEWQIETADGDRRWLDVQATSATVGGEERVLTISRDVTERRRTKRRLEAILDRIDEAIFLARASELDSPSPAPDYLSSGYEEIWGQPLKNIQERYDEGFFGTLHADDAPGYRAFIETILEDVESGATRDQYTREYRIERPDGELRWVHSDFYPLTWDGGEPRIVILSRDVTDRKRREQRMASFEAATDDLATADSPQEATRTATDAARETLGLSAVATFLYNEVDGTLEPDQLSDPLEDAIGSVDIDPGTGPLWDVFATGGVASGADAELELLDHDGTLSDWRAIALGNHGVLLVGTCGDSMDSETIQSAHVLAGTLEAALNHLRSEERLTAQQQELETQTERAQRLERVAELTQHVEQAITEASTRQGIEESVCDRLAAIDPYELVWIGRADVGTDRLSPRIVAGTSTAIQPIDLENPSPDPHPALQSWRTNEVRVIEGLVAGGPSADWRERALEAGYQSICAVPLSHGARTHGVIVIGATRPSVFSETETAAFEQLGSSIGNALTAVERRRALESDDTTEIEFRAEESRLHIAEVATVLECTVRHTRTVRREDGSVSVFYELDGDINPAEELVPDIEEIYPDRASVDCVTQDPSRMLVEVRRQSWFGDLLADYGGVLRHAKATPQETTISVEVPTGVEVRSFVQQFQERDPDIELVARRQHQHTDRTPQETTARLEERLTDRQREVLETALASGYFEWPRDQTAEELAQRLDISQPTVGKHLRKAERKAFELLLEDQ